MELNTGGDSLFVALPAISLIDTSPRMVHPKRQGWGSHLIHIQSQGPSRVFSLILFGTAVTVFDNIGPAAPPDMWLLSTCSYHILGFREDLPTSSLRQDLSQCGVQVT